MGRGRRRRGPYGLGDDGLVSAEARRYGELLARLEAHSAVKVAALVGARFGIDPVLVLLEPDHQRATLRLAAHNVVVKAENAANRPA